MKAFAGIRFFCVLLAFPLFMPYLASAKPKDAQTEKYKIGDTGPAGGIVFYSEKYPKMKYYEIAPVETEVQCAWGLFGKRIGTSTGIGTGLKNTELLIALSNNDEIDAAPQMCRNLAIKGFTDWFLPSRDELYLMYSVLFLNDSGDFCHKLYWSSSEAKTNPLSIAYDFGEVTVNGGKEYPGDRASKHQVRAIRAFSVNAGKKEYQIGERGPAGGWIFDRQKKDKNSWSYLEAAPSETEFVAKWGLANATISTARGEWQSKPNTQKIIDSLSSMGEEDRAAQLCDSLVVNGYDDWCLPSADALLRFYENILAHDTVDSSGKIYWSSTEFDYDQSLGLSVSENSANIAGFAKNEKHIVRAIRVFN